MSHKLVMTYHSITWNLNAYISKKLNFFNDTNNKLHIDTLLEKFSVKIWGFFNLNDAASFLHYNYITVGENFHTKTILDVQVSAEIRVAGSSIQKSLRKSYYVEST